MVQSKPGQESERVEGPRNRAAKYSLGVFSLFAVISESRETRSMPAVLGRHTIGLLADEVTSYPPQTELGPALHKGQSSKSQSPASLIGTVASIRVPTRPQIHAHITRCTLSNPATAYRAECPVSVPVIVMFYPGQTKVSQFTRARPL